MGQWALGMGHWALGMGHWAMGIGNNSFPFPFHGRCYNGGEPQRQMPQRREPPHGTGAATHCLPFPPLQKAFSLLPFPLFQCSIPHSLFLIDFCSGFGNTLSFSISTAFPG
jgi:hypothetical protein